MMELWNDGRVELQAISAIIKMLLAEGIESKLRNVSHVEK
jgi:hypothetical protein